MTVSGEHNKTCLNASFAYQPNYLKMWLLVMVFCSMSLFAALSSDNGRVPGALTKLLTYIGWDAHVVVKVIGVLGVVFCVFIMAILIASMFSGKKKSIQLSATTLFIPAGHFSAKINEIRCSDILSVNIGNVMNQRFIRIDHKAGKVDLAQSMFKNKEIFNDCYGAIMRSIK
jgi:hypothetical protein